MRYGDSNVDRVACKHRGSLVPDLRLSVIALLALAICSAEALATVDLVGSWSGETQFETNGFNYTPGAGSNRVVLIVVAAESNTDPITNVNQVTLGGQTLTAIESADGVVVGTAGSYHNLLWLGYLTETGIASMSGNALSVSWDQAPNTPFGEIMVQAATYEDVVQSSPVADSASNVNTSAATIQAGSVSVGTGDRLVYVTLDGQPADHTAPGGYSEQLEQDGPANDFSCASVERTTTTSSSQDPTASWSVTSRLAIISVVLDEYVPADVTSNLLDYLKLNDGSGNTATDSSGNGNHATLGSGSAAPSWKEGIFGNALEFGGNDYVDLPNSSPGSDLGSVSLWFSTTTNFSDYAMLYYGSSVSTGNGVGSENELHINFNSDETVSFFIEGGASDVSITSPSTYSDGAWHNVVATWDISGNAVLYIDGSLINFVTHDANNFSFSSVHRLGRPGTAERYFTGKIDEVRVFDRALSPVDVAVLSEGYGLSAHWKLDDGAGGTATDSVRGQDGMVNGAAWSNGIKCGALDFDGGTDYVDLNTGCYATSAWTVSFWTKPNSPDDYDRIFIQGSTGCASRQLMVYWHSNHIEVRTVTDGSAGDPQAATAALTDSVWTHFAWTSDGATHTLYLNGATSSGSTTGSNVGIAGDNNLGRRDAGNYYDSMLDDVRVYNRVLSPAEIQSLAAVYTVLDGGTFTGDPSAGTAINDCEEVVGYDEFIASGKTTGWFSQYCLMTGLGTLGGGSFSEAYGINNSSVVCGAADNGMHVHAVTWTSGGGLTDLGVLTDRDSSESYAINSSNEVVGTSLNIGAEPSDWMAFIYLPSPAHTLGAGLNSLGTLGGDDSTARDINDAGVVVGGAQQSDGDMRPYSWTNGSMTDLGSLGGESLSILHRAEGINNNDEIVGLSYTAGGDQHAFLYLPSAAYGQGMGMNDLGTLSSGDTSVALDINDDGKVVGTSNLAASGTTYHAFIWENGTVTDLNDLIDSNSGWTLNRATGINQDGEIVGFGTNSSGDIRAFTLVQTCATGAVPVIQFDAVAFAALETSGSDEKTQAVVDSNGVMQAYVTVKDAAARRLFDVDVVRAAPVDEADQPANGSSAGLLSRRVIVSSNADAGSFTMTVALPVQAQELADAELKPDQIELVPVAHSTATKDAVQLLATHYVGEREPTGVIGQNGFVSYDNGSIDLWLETDHAGAFAPKVRSNATPLPDDMPNAPSDGEMPPMTPGTCGMGAISAALFATLALLPARLRRRRRS